MHRFKAKGISSRVFSTPQWVNPKDRVTKWNIVTGDKVAIIAGKDKDTIGEIKAVDRKNNTVIVEGKKMAKKHVAQQPGAPDGIFRKELPIHYSNVMLIHPDTQAPTKVERRKVTKVVEGREVSYWSRFVKGTNVEIPKPARKYNDVGEELFTTESDDVLNVTYKPDLTQPPFPQDLVRELRNPYKKKFVMDMSVVEETPKSA